MSRVLVVDDNPSDRTLAGALLESLGADVEQAAEGFSALEALDENKGFDLLVIDLTMPKMSGLELIKRIRGNSQWRGIPIVIMSGRNEEADVRAAIKGGAKDYITKPIDHDVFKKKLTKFIDGESEHWAEHEIPADFSEKHATLLLRSDCQLTGISEIGGTLLAGAGLKKGYVLEIEISIFSRAGLGPTSIRIEESVKKKEKFEMKFVFVGITDEKRQIIRSFAQEMWRKRKSVEEQPGL